MYTETIELHARKVFILPEQTDRKVLDYVANYTQSALESKVIPQ